MSVRPPAVPSSTDTPDELDPLTLLGRLEHREREVTRLWEHLVERVSLFPNPASLRRHEATELERDQLRREIADLRDRVTRAS